MKEINIQIGKRNSKILIGEKFQNLRNYISIKNSIIISDNNVFRLYKDSFPNIPKIILNSGEENKTLKNIEKIYSKFFDYNADRTTFIIGIGGGVISDMTGFAATTYNRGMRFGFVATTLLAQVDAAIGGKNGVNFQSYKNIIGTISQPKFVISDLNFLDTLDRKQVINGLAEAVKTAIIKSPKLFKLVSDYSLKNGFIQKILLEDIIYKCAEIKSQIVIDDEREQGKRMILNFGHTIGHAIESTTGLTHGESISLGMIGAINISEKRGLISNSLKCSIIDSFNKIGLTIDYELNNEKIIEAIYKDKKRKNDVIQFILIKDIGEAIIEDISLEILKGYINDMY